MLDQIKKSVYTAVGLAVMTVDKIEEVGKKIASDAEMSEKEGKLFVEDLKKKGEETKNAIEKLVNEKVEKTLKTLSIPTHSEIDKLEKRIAIIEQKLSETDSK
jgi:polyhydroxyalkanoate synthesis regulator phasin